MYIGSIYQFNLFEYYVNWRVFAILFSMSRVRVLCGARWSDARALAPLASNFLMPVRFLIKSMRDVILTLALIISDIFQTKIMIFFFVGFLGIVVVVVVVYVSFLHFVDDKLKF